jgi:hypothetical protein
VAVESKDKLKMTMKKKIANSFNMPKTTLFTIVKNKTKIMEAFEQSKFEARRKRSHTVVHENFEGSLLKWISQARSLNILPRVTDIIDSMQAKYIQL